MATTLEELDKRLTIIEEELALRRQPATDAILLRSAIDLAAILRMQGEDLILVASDQRLLRAAKNEGIAIFNPEVQTVADFNALLV